MKLILNRRFVIAVLTVTSLMTVLLTVAPIRSDSPRAREYDPWLDWNDDGKIDMRDISRVALAFGRGGLNFSKASLAYDSGWLDLRNETGKYYTITHNLNDTGLQVDARERTMQWNRTYGGTGYDLAHSLVQTVDGGYALAGYTTSFGAGGYDAYLLRIDASGNMLWNRTYGGTDFDVTYSLVQTVDGGYALAGVTGFSYPRSWDLWLIKTDASGTMQWNKTYGGTDIDVGSALVQTVDGGYALAAETRSFGDPSGDCWLVKTDASGTVQWNKTYGGASGDYAIALVQTSDDGYAIAGGGFANLVKTDADGNVQWIESYGDVVANALVQTSDSGYALAERTYSLGNNDFWLAKTDALGTMQWNMTYGGTKDDWAYAFVKTSDGGYALAGYTDSFGAGMNDFWLVKTDASGNMQWNKTYGGTNDDDACALVQTSDGGYALAGDTRSFGDPSGDCWLVKTDASGNIGSGESGLVWMYSSVNTIALYRGTTDAYWNYVRVRLWKPR